MTTSAAEKLRNMKNVHYGFPALCSTSLYPGGRWSGGGTGGGNGGPGPCGANETGAHQGGWTRQQRREVTLGKPLWCDETLAAQLLRPPFEILEGQRRRKMTLAGQRRCEVTLASQRRREVTLAGQRRCEVTLAGQRRREVTLAGQRVSGDVK